MCCSQVFKEHLFLPIFWLFKIHHDSQITIFAHNLYKTESNKVVCSLELGFLLSVKWSLHTYRTCSSHCFILSWWCLQSTCMYQCCKLYNCCLILFTNRCAPCTAPELCVGTLSGILASVRKKKQACPMHCTLVVCSSVRNFGFCQEKETGMPHALDLSCV